MEDRLRKEIKLRELQENRLIEMKVKIEKLEEIANVEIAKSPASQQAEVSPSLPSATGTPSVLFREYDSYKAAMNQKLMNLEHLVKEERSKTARFEVLKMENAELKQSIAEQDRKVAILNDKIKSFEAGKHKVGDISFKAESGKSAQKPLDIDDAGHPGYVHKVKQMMFERNQFQGSFQLKNKTANEMVDEISMIKQDQDLANHVGLLIEISSMGSHTDLSAIDEANNKVQNLPKTSSKTLDQMRQSMLNMISQIQAHTKRNVEREKISSSLSEELRLEVKLLQERLVQSDTLLLNQWEEFNVERKTLEDTIDSLRKSNTAIREEYNTKIKQAQDQTDILNLELERTRNEILIVGEKLKSKSAEQEDLISASKELELKINNLNLKLSHKQTEINEKMEVVSVLQAEIYELKSLKSSHSNELKVLSSKLDETFNLLEKEHETEKQKSFDVISR